MQVYGESESRVRQVTLVQDELSKFTEEMGKLDSWMNSAEDQLRTIQRQGGDLESLKSQAEHHKVRFFSEMHTLYIVNNEIFFLIYEASLLILSV